MTGRLRGLDAGFLAAESAGMYMHVIGVLLLDPTSAPAPVGFATIERLLEERIHLLPPFRWRLVPVPLDLDHPRWVEDPDFDLSRHLRHVTLPQPGTIDVLAELVGLLASTPLPRDRPLWEMVVVEGLDDGQVALVTKLHHSFMDGGAGNEVMASLFDLAPEPAPVGDPSTRWAPAPVPSPIRLVAESPLGTLERMRQLPGAVRDTMRAVPATVGSLWSEGVGAPAVGRPSPWRSPLGADRWAALERRPLDEVREASRSLGVTVNDVLLGAVAGAVRAELIDQGARAHQPMLCMVPVSEREAGDESFATRTSALQVALPVHLADPVARVAAVRERTAVAKSLHASMGDGLVDAWVDLVPPPVLTRSMSVVSWALARRALPAPFDLVVSNIAGPPVPLYLGGARVTHLYALGPLFQAAGLNVTVLSHDGVLDVGVVGSTNQAPSIARRLGTELDAIHQAGRAASRPDAARV